MSPEQIREFIKRHGLTTRTFAELLGVTSVAVTNWLDDKRALSLPMARLLRMFDKHPELMKDFGK
jgi:DNA-binding transcriptional regulator YiaG